MTDVLTIPGVETVHPRSEWTDPLYPITGPACQWNLINRPVAHYTADDDLIDGDPGEHADQLDEYMRAMQQSYVDHRGYSLGYWFSVDWLGGAWQIRGWDTQSAANKGDIRKTGVKNINPWTGPILFLVDGADRLTAEAAHTGRMLYAEMDRRSIHNIGRPSPHSDLDYTSCCGDGIRLDINQGLLDPAPPPIVEPPPTNPPPSGDDDMRILPSPVRLFDSRNMFGGNKVPAGEHGFETPINIPVTDSLLITVTAVDSGNGYVTVWASGARPEASCLNYHGPSVANTTAVAVQDRKFKLFNSSPTHLIVDVVGYQ